MSSQAPTPLENMTNMPLRFMENEMALRFLSTSAASRRSLDRVSVPVWLVVLSDQLLIVALVSLYLTN